MVAASLDQTVRSTLAALEHAGLTRALPVVVRGRDTQVRYNGLPALDFSSNDYLGLARDPRVAGALAGAALTEGAGAGAARLISGNHPLHERLEEALAAFKGAEAALLFSSGYLANLGTLPALMDAGDALYADELNHASLVDGARLTGAERRIFPHGDLDALERLLEADRGRVRHRLIAVEGLFSMGGDLFPLAELVQLARRHDAWTYVDDAHGTGVLGAGGRGALEHLGVEGAVDVVMGTLSKALGTAGAFVAASRSVIECLRNRARSFVFTTASPPALAAAALAALRIAAEEPWRRERVRANARRLREALAALGCTAGGAPDSPVVPVVVGEAAGAVRASRALARHGFLVGAVRPPAVPRGTARLRLSLSASHEPAQVDALAEAVAEALPPRR